MIVAFPVLPKLAGLDRDQAAARLVSGDMNFLIYEKLEFVSDYANKNSFIANAGSLEAPFCPISRFHSRIHIPFPAPADRYGYSLFQQHPVRRCR